jgi:tetratricopeptide (TPR) repeat protein
METMETEVVVAPPSHSARIGQRIRRARLARNMTQGDLARGIFSVSYISAVERGQIRPSLVALEQLASRLQLHVAELLSEEHDAEIEAALRAGAEGMFGSDQARGDVISRLREAQSLARLGRGAEALGILRELLEQPLAPRDLTLVRFALATALATQGQLEAARAELEQALVSAEQAGDRDLLERCRYDLGQVHRRLDQPLLALECHRAGYIACQRGIIRDVIFKLNIMSALGQDYLDLGAYAEAIHVLEEAVTLANKTGGRDGQGHIFQALADAYRAQNDMPHAKRYALLSIQSYEEAGDKRQAARMQTWLGRAYLDTNQLEDAEAHLEVARDTAKKLEDLQGAAEAARDLSTLYLRRTAYAAAEASAREALAEGAADPLLRAEALIALGEALQAHGKRRDAEKEVRAALQLLRTGVSPRRSAQVLARTAAFYEERGDTTQALESLKQAWRSAGRL